MKPQLPYQLRKKQIWGLLILGVLIIILKAGFYFYRVTQVTQLPELTFHSAAPSEQMILTEFNPNALDDKQWRNLGFSDKQVSTILKYKEVVGGKFISKAQLKKCYAISDAKYSELKDYILLPETTNQSTNFVTKPYRTKLKIPGKFNPNAYSLEDWMALGYSKRQAGSILRYKTAVGGKFTSKEELAQSFIINGEDFNKMRPYLILPERAPSHPNNVYTLKKTKSYAPFDPNTLDIEGWKQLGFSESQAKSILKYKDKILNGSFRNLEDVQKSYIIQSRFEELKPYIRLNPETMSRASSFTATNNPKNVSSRTENTNFNTTDLNTITYRQLLEFGLDKQSAGRIVGFRRKLGGFVSKEQILTTYDIDKAKVQELLTICPLNTASVQKYTLLDAPEDWLKSHPYFKYSADKIIFYRISFKDEKKIWRKLKLKPKYEKRMRWYLK